MTALTEVQDQLKMKFLLYLRDCAPMILDGATFDDCREFILRRMNVCYLTSQEHDMIRSLIKYVNS